MPIEKWYHFPVGNSSKRSSGYSKKLKAKRNLASKTRSGRRNSNSFFRSVSSRPHSSKNFRSVSSKLSSGFKRKASALTHYFNKPIKPEGLSRHHSV